MSTREQALSAVERIAAAAAESVLSEIEENGDNVRFRDKVAAMDSAFRHRWGERIVLVRPDFLEAATRAYVKSNGNDGLEAFLDALESEMPLMD